MLVSDNAVHHQIAYVTNDMDKACEVFARDYGVESFFHLSDGKEPSPALPGLRLKLALAHVNGIEIELIEPTDGTKNIYSDVLPEDGHFVLVMHHVCIRITGGIENWNRHRAALDQDKHPIVIQGSLPDVVEFFYTDERSRLGHYLEHVWLSPATLEMMAQQIPNYPA
jgi:hypothetical protein